MDDDASKKNEGTGCESFSVDEVITGILPVANGPAGNPVSLGKPEKVKKKKSGFDPNVKKQNFPNPRGFNVNRCQAPKRYT